MSRRPPDPSTPGGRIAIARAAKEWNQEQLAERMSVSRSAVAQWETNRSGQLRDNLGKLARVLGVTAEHIMYGGGGGDALPSMAAGDREITILRLFRECEADDQDLLILSAMRFAGSAAVQSLDADYPLAKVGPGPADR